MVEINDGVSDKKFLNSSWYGEVAEYLKNGGLVCQRVTKIQKGALIRKSRNYFYEGGELFFVVKGKTKKCVVREEVAGIFKMEHDLGRHFSQAITLRKLKEYYWPKMARDVRDYIQGCLICAKFGTALRSQLSARVAVNEPKELLGLDFAGPFPKFTGISKRWILVAVDYFSRYVWTEVTDRNDSETVINFLQKNIVRSGM